MQQDRRKFLGKLGLTMGAGIGATQAFASHENKVVVEEYWVDMKKAGADVTGKFKNTKLIKNTIEQLANAGGGTLYFPPGKYLTGAIHMLSNITIHLEGGAEIIFSEDFDDYLPMVPSRWQGLAVKNFSPLIYANSARNIRITGNGTINGSGQVWWDYILKKRATYKQTGSEPGSSWQDTFFQENQDREQLQSFGFLRPSLFQAYHCEEIFLQDVFLRNSPFWTTHFVECNKVVVDGIDIHNPDSPNTDGINPESSRNVRISNCHIDVDDDCITIKSGKGDWGRKNAGPCENIVVTNCVMTGGASGVGIGSEMSGGVRNVAISNCVFDGPSTGVHIKSNRERGGIVEDIQISNLVMKNIGKSPAIHINTKYWIDSSPEPVNEKTPQFRNILVSNITGTNCKRSVEIIGLEEFPVQNISLSQIKISAEQGLICENAERVQMQDIHINSPEVPYQFRDCKKLWLNGLDTNFEAEAPIQFHNVQQVAVNNSLPFHRQQKILISGKESTGINPDVALRTKEGLTYKNGASENSIEKL